MGTFLNKCVSNHKSSEVIKMKKLFWITASTFTFVLGILAVLLYSFALNLDEPPKKVVEVLSSDSFNNVSSLLPHVVAAERSTVYSAIIEDMYLDDSRILAIQKKNIICEKMNEANSFKLDMAESAANELGLNSEIKADFIAKTTTCGQVDNGLIPPIAYKFVSEKEMDVLFPKGKSPNKKLFSAKYPYSRSLISFSNIGFNPTSTLAFVYTENRCEPLCGGGSYILLAKEYGEWRVKNHIILWKS
jgi:hypothetical protein